LGGNICISFLVNYLSLTLLMISVLVTSLNFLLWVRFVNEWNELLQLKQNVKISLSQLLRFLRWILVQKCFNSTGPGRLRNIATFMQLGGEHDNLREIT
jgi:hypothetical protein